MCIIQLVSDTAHETACKRAHLSPSLRAVCVCLCVLPVCVCVCVCAQVSQLMYADRAKLIARSQLPVQLAPRPLGQPAAAAAADCGVMDQQGDSAGGAGAAGAVSERARDPETYDEGDFYSQLLKELLESGECVCVLLSVGVCDFGGGGGERGGTDGGISDGDGVWVCCM